MDAGYSATHITKSYRQGINTNSYYRDSLNEKSFPFDDAKLQNSSSAGMPDSATKYNHFVYGNNLKSSVASASRDSLFQQRQYIYDPQPLASKQRQYSCDEGNYFNLISPIPSSALLQSATKVPEDANKTVESRDFIKKHLYWENLPQQTIRSYSMDAGYPADGYMQSHGQESSMPSQNSLDLGNLVCISRHNVLSSSEHKHAQQQAYETNQTQYDNTLDTTCRQPRSDCLLGEQDNAMPVTDNEPHILLDDLTWARESSPADVAGSPRVLQMLLVF